MRNLINRSGFFSYIIFLQLLFASYRLFPSFDIFNPVSIFLPMGELIIIIILLSPGIIQGLRFFISVLSAGILLFYTIGEIFYRLIYLENFQMITDIHLVPGLFVMIIPENLLSPDLTRAFAIMFSVILASLLGYLLLIPVKKIFHKNKTRLNPFIISLLIIISSVIIYMYPENSPGFSIAKDLIPAKESEPVVSEQEITPEIADTRWQFPGIKDSDIHLVVVESYGATLFQRPEYKEHILILYSELEPLLYDDGWIVKSGYVNSPAFGGRSWLADATLLAGRQIEDQKTFDERITNGNPAWFLKLMEDNSYHRYYVAPGTTRTSDEWKKAYPFDTYLIRPDFGYEGPNIAFGTLTDQFAFDFLARNYLDDSRNEFAFYLLVSSHTPFVRIPLFKPDWDFSRKGKEYEEGYIRIFNNNWLSGKELAEGYLAGISYSLETTIRYLTEVLTRNELMVIIGDHQPRKPVSGTDPGFPVLFHIIAPAAGKIFIPGDWELSSGLVPPELPVDYNEIPEMAEIPMLIESILRGEEEHRELE
ncbi:MAG: hypothetical protein RBT69_08885 [Spirochaetia bacterium]|nr:hypothetical protein [Spirochaetia bacterium]